MLCVHNITHNISTMAKWFLEDMYRNGLFDSKLYPDIYQTTIKEQTNGVSETNKNGYGMWLKRLDQ